MAENAAAGEVGLADVHIEVEWLSEDAKTAFEHLQEIIRDAWTPPKWADKWTPEQHAHWKRETSDAVYTVKEEAARIYLQHTRRITYIKAESL